MSLFGAIDSFLGAVENGALEKRVNQGLDKVEATLDSALTRGEKLADTSEHIVKKASAAASKADALVDKVQSKIK